MRGDEVMLETARFIFDNGNNLTVNIIMCFIGVYAILRVHKIEGKHDKEFAAMRAEHRSEREVAQTHLLAALDKLALETAAANKERAEIKALIDSVVSFNASTERALHDYDLILNQMAVKFDLQARCDLRHERDKWRHDEFERKH